MILSGPNVSYNIGMTRILIFMLCICSFSAFGQDERYYRSIFSGDLFNLKDNAYYYKVKVSSPKYVLDLNRDTKDDSFQTIKMDGNDFIQINDEYGREVFRGMLETKGKNSSIFRASFKQVDKNTDVLILHFYEGEAHTSTYEATARLYFVTIPNRNLNKITMTKGPFFWTERERAAGKYWNRRYSVNTLDYNNDGSREISVSFNSISRVYFYLNGSWQNI